ncbi:MAG: hypothetical protein AAB295_00780, partial [Chloroflexota bacterium]
AGQARPALLVKYGDQVGSTSRSFENADKDNPERGARESRRRLTGYFESLNRAPMNRIKAMVQRCAAP